MRWPVKGPARIRSEAHRQLRPGQRSRRKISTGCGAGIHSPPLSRLHRVSPSPVEGPPVVETSLWNQCLRRLEAELPEQHFNTWIRPLQAVEDGGRLRLLAPNRYVVDWVNQNCAAAHRRARGRAGARSGARGRRRGRAQRAPPMPQRLRCLPAGGRPRDRARSAHGAAAAVRRPPEPGLHVRQLRRGQEQPARDGRRAAGRREPGPGLQPAVHLRRRRPRQDAPDARHRQP